MGNIRHVSTPAAIEPWPGPTLVTASRSQTMEEWAAGHRALIDEMLCERGAILFRGFDVDSVDKARRATAALTERLLDYVYRSTPRVAVADNLYTATEYPATETIPMHNENSYQRDWPMRIVFCCVQPAETGGATPLAWTPNVTRRIDAGIVRRFADRGVMYVRNFGHGIDLPWQTTFQTESREDVIAFCRSQSIDCEWLPGDRLRTQQVCQAVAHHPVSGALLWFNQAHLFHVSALGPDDQQAMLEVFGEARLPRHAYFGDGEPIDEQALEAVRRAYREETFTFAWQKGDVLLLDNMLVCHSRAPFTGPRKVLVAMGDPISGYARPAAEGIPSAIAAIGEQR